MRNHYKSAFKKHQAYPLTLLSIFTFTFYVALLSSCATQKTTNSEDESVTETQKSNLYADAALQIPETPREFRAVWVATVANIDWPSERGLPVEEQKKELIQILNRAA